MLLFLFLAFPLPSTLVPRTLNIQGPLGLPDNQWTDMTNIFL